MSDEKHCPFTDEWSEEAWLERVAIMVESGMDVAEAYRQAEKRVAKERLRVWADNIARSEK